MSYIGCCFSGHRDVAVGKQLEKRLEKAVRRLYDSGVTAFYCGGASGFDTAAALAVLKLKARFPEERIALKLVLPYKRQYPTSEHYNYLLRNADEITYARENYVKTCYSERNRFMVENSSVCLCYYDPQKRHSGTGETVAYAASRRLEIINLFLHNDNDEFTVNLFDLDEYTDDFFWNDK